VRYGRLLSLIWIAISALICPAAMAGPAGTLEYAVKATFLYKFAGFVEWPPASFASPSSPVTICVLGNDPVAMLIDEAASGQQAGNRAIAVKHLQAFTRDAGCHILYLAANAAVSDVLNAARGVPVLTVADTVRAESEGSIVTFVVQDNRVRFDIDDAAAARNGLAISSKLLSLARAVRSRP
jgi:hypothetical protein